MKLFTLLFAFVVLFFAPDPAQAQATPTVQGHGCHISLAVDLTQARSEEKITYTVDFSLLDSAIMQPNAFSISLFYPDGAVVVGGQYPAQYSGCTPQFDFSKQNQVIMRFTAVAVPAQTVRGQFQVSVKVPANRACNLADLVAHASLMYPVEHFINTDDLHTTLHITNPWYINKQHAGLTYIGNSGAGGCQYATASRQITYRIQISRTNTGKIGSQDVWVNQMQDNPSVAGAAFGNVTNVWNAANISFAGTSGTFSLPAGFRLDAVNEKDYIFTFVMTLPPGTPPQCFWNVVKITGHDSCGRAIEIISDTSRALKVDTLVNSFVVSKGVIMHGNVPGCLGTYVIRIKNPNAAPMTGYTFYDPLPSCITQVTGTHTATIPTSGAGSPVISQVGVSPYKFKLTSTATLLQNQEHDYYIDFIIGSGCTGRVPNTVYADLACTQPVDSAIFVLLPNQIKPCLKKSICRADSNIGGTIRFKLRVQNYGTVPMTAWQLIDDLKSIGLSYIGNERYYYTTTRYKADAACSPAVNGTTIRDWSANVSHNWNPATGILTYSFSTLNLDCDSATLYEDNPYSCTGGSRLPAYYIEFDALITGQAGIGASINKAKLYDAAGVVWAIDSIPFTINDAMNLTLKKEVSINGGPFGPGGTAAPGQNIQYRLTVNSTGLTLYNPYLIDLLPQNTGTGITGAMLNDRYLMKDGDRGSNCDVYYDGFVSSAAPYLNPQLSVDDRTDLYIRFDLGNSAVPGTTVATWLPNNPSTTTKNIRINYPTTPLVATQELAYTFNAKMNGIKGQHACNTFAVAGFKKSMINYNSQLIRQWGAESAPVCVGISGDTLCCRLDSFIVPQTACASFATQFCAVDRCGNDIDYKWYFDNSPIPQAGKCVTHTFTTTGGHSVSVRWTDCDGIHEQTYELAVRNCRECDIRPVFTDSVYCPWVDFDATRTYSNQPGVIYVWNFGDGTFGAGPLQLQHYYAPGTYTVTLTVYSLNEDGDICQCSSKTDRQVHVPDCKEGDGGYNKATYSLAKAKAASAKPATGGITSSILLVATPNPFKQSLSVSLQQAKEARKPGTAYTILLLSDQGSTVATSKITASATVQLNTSACPAGIYLLTLQGADGIVKSTKVVKLNQ